MNRGRRDHRDQRGAGPGGGLPRLPLVAGVSGRHSDHELDVPGGDPLRGTLLGITWEFSTTAKKSPYFLEMFSTVIIVQFLKETARRSFIVILASISSPLTNLTFDAPVVDSFALSVYF